MSDSVYWPSTLLLPVFRNRNLVGKVRSETLHNIPGTRPVRACPGLVVQSLSPTTCMTRHGGNLYRATASNVISKNIRGWWVGFNLSVAVDAAVAAAEVAAGAAVSAVPWSDFLLRVPRMTRCSSAA